MAEAELEPHTVYLALGANLGSRRNSMREALQSLAPQVKILAQSRLYETAPAYVLDQPIFLNMVIRAHTALPPAELLAYLKQLENKIGRAKTIRYGPREIDLDIIFYNDVILETPALKIPHPRMHERGFVLRPLADIAPDLRHPVLKKTISQLLAALPEDDGILAITDW